MNKKGVSTLQGILLGIVTVGFFIGSIQIFVESNQQTGDLTGYNSTDLANYNNLDEISVIVQAASADIETTTADPNAFDFFSNIISQVLAPFKFIYNSIEVLKEMLDFVVNDLGLPKLVKDYFVAVFTIIVLIGIVMIKFFWGRRK